MYNIEGNRKHAASKLNVPVDPQIETRFRKKVGEVKGAHKGAVKECVEEALEEWTQKHGR